MGAGHGHGHGQVVGQAAGHAGGRHRWRLGAAAALVGSFFVVELVYGLLSGSLALLSDAGHMAADVVTLTAALVATKIATRPDATGRRTYGSYRAEVFASGFAVLVMLGMAVYIGAEAVSRIGGDAEVSSGPMLIVGALGLVINLIALVMLRAGASESLNVKGAYLESPFSWSCARSPWAGRCWPCSGSTPPRAWTSTPWPVNWPPLAVSGTSTTCTCGR